MSIGIGQRPKLARTSNGIVPSFVEHLQSNDENSMGEIRDPLSRGIRVGETVLGILEQGNKLDRALIMAAEIDPDSPPDTTKLELLNCDQVNVGIGLGLETPNMQVDVRSISLALARVAGEGSHIITTNILSHDDYTPREFEDMTSDNPEIAHLFPVPEIAVRFSVILPKVSKK